MTRRTRDRAAGSRAACRGEQRGAALVLALVLVTGLGLVGLAALDMASESFHEDGAARVVREQLYGATGAIDTLANALRGDVSWGREGVPCAGLSLGTDDGAVVQVTCTPLAGSGAAIGGGLGARADRVVDLIASIAGVRVARARFEIVDVGGSAPGAAVRVRDWTVAR